MTDLIDREEAKRLLFEMGKEKAALALDEVPTIRCEDCNFRNREHGGRSCTNPYMEQVDDGMPVEFWPPDGFGCVYFERRQP